MGDYVHSAPQIERDWNWIGIILANCLLLVLMVNIRSGIPSTQLTLRRLNEMSEAKCIVLCLRSLLLARTGCKSYYIKAL